MLSRQDSHQGDTELVVKQLVALAGGQLGEPLRAGEHDVSRPRLATRRGGAAVHAEARSVEAPQDRLEPRRIAEYRRLPEGRLLERTAERDDQGMQGQRPE